MQQGERRLVRQTIQRCLAAGQAVTVFLFGSRARGDHRPFSDVDLLLEAEPEITPLQWQEMRAAFEEGELPYKVDLVATGSLYGPYRTLVMSERKKLFDVHGGFCEHPTTHRNNG